MRSDKPKDLKETFAKLQETLFNRQKYIKNEFQAYGLDLAKELHDWKNRSLYIRLAKTIDRRILDKARYFVKDHSPGQVDSPARLFMWKLKALKQELSDLTK